MSDSKVNIPQLIIVLTAICVVAALALSGVYEVTKEPIAEQIRLARLRAIKAVLPAYDNQPDQETQSVVIGKDRRGKDVVVTFYKATLEGQPVGTAFAVPEKGFGGGITVMIGLTPQQAISGVEILLHKETPGLGAKVEKKAFRSQFIGKSLLTGKLALKRDGGEIDQITGASISSRAVTKAIKRGLELYQKEFGLQGEQHLTSSPPGGED